MPFTAHQYEVFADVEDIKTLDILDSLTGDPEKMFLQSLLIQQRILGTNNVDLQENIEKNTVRSYLTYVVEYKYFSTGVTEQDLVSMAA